MILHIGNLGWVQLGGFFWSRLGSDDLSSRHTQAYFNKCVEAGMGGMSGCSAKYGHELYQYNISWLKWDINMKLLLTNHKKTKTATAGIRSLP